ncbi:NAD(P)/FAD-dependent oxidoreductase [Actinokineospora pegani]|uniref:NAD(P)/FAD-dependent oxidoreductase n=1 Tax=Actinokineospora pegani TaxID=2654637 RepID=UPI0012EA1744|nr:NAD(P)/FAD-dependent oxidoreductase [Actinokineospora pegani]
MRVVVVGGGYVGLYAARHLARRGKGQVEVTVVDPESSMTYQPFLPEAAAGNVEPRHVVVPLREVLRGCRVVAGRATSVDPDARSVAVDLVDGGSERIDYDRLVLAPGSVSKTLPIPGLAERATGFKSLGEAIGLRNQVLSTLDAAQECRDPARRRALLSYVFVGGGYAGVEAMAELQDLARYATRFHDGIEPRDLRWTLVEAMDRIMPEVSADLGEYTVAKLRERDVDVRLGTQVKSLENGRVRLSDGEEFDAETFVWTAGVTPNPLVRATGLPLDERDRIRCDATLRVVDHPEVFAAGDCAAVPDLASDEPDATCPPSAQHAVRQGKRLGANILASVRGEALKPYKHRNAGSVASLGLYRGVAQVYGVKMTGLPAWLMHRGYHLAAMPTTARKARILADWALASVFPRHIAALGELREPRAEFELATRAAC